METLNWKVPESMRALPLAPETGALKRSQDQPKVCHSLAV